MDGRLAALRSAAPLVASTRDNALVSGYARELAGLLGMDIEEVRAEVMRATARSGRRPAKGRPMAAESRAAAEVGARSTQQRLHQGASSADTELLDELVADLGRFASVGCVASAASGRLYRLRAIVS